MMCLLTFFFFFIHIWNYIFGQPIYIDFTNYISNYTFSHLTTYLNINSYCNFFFYYYIKTLIYYIFNQNYICSLKTHGSTESTQPNSTHQVSAQGVNTAHVQHDARLNIQHVRSKSPIIVAVELDYKFI